MMKVGLRDHKDFSRQYMLQRAIHKRRLIFLLAATMELRKYVLLVAWGVCTYVIYE